MPGNHALLAPSSSERWINCPPSAKENAVQQDTSSSYAQQGTDAHALCEYKVKKALGHRVRDPTEDLTYFDEEMAECSDTYCEFVMEQVETAKQNCSDPLVLVEQRLDFTRWVAESFGRNEDFFCPFEQFFFANFGNANVVTSWLKNNHADGLNVIQAFKQV